MVVGFVGLGNMGAFMARNLAKSGVKVRVFDVNKVVLDKFRQEGFEVASSPAEVADSALSVVTMVPSNSHVLSVYTSKDGVLQTLSPGSLCVDCSTISPQVASNVAEQVKAKQSEFVDAPVSGGVVGAENATLTFMAGGSKEAVNRAVELFKAMGKNWVHCGRVGTGQAAKICNNMLLGIEMIGVAEALHLGEKLGLDPKVLSGIINTSSGRCWSSDTYNPVPGVLENVPSSRDYAGGFGNQLIAKDLGLAQSASTEVAAPTPLGSLAHQIYRILANHPDFKNKDCGSVYKFIKEQK